MYLDPGLLPCHFSVVATTPFILRPPSPWEEGDEMGTKVLMDSIYGPGLTLRACVQLGNWMGTTQRVTEGQNWGAMRGNREGLLPKSS